MSTSAHRATGTLWSIRRTAAGLVAALALVGTGAGAASAASAASGSRSEPSSASVSAAGDPGYAAPVTATNEANRSNRN